MVACGGVVGVVAGVEELGGWRRLIVGAVHDRPCANLTRPSHPASSDLQLEAPGGLVKLAHGPVRAMVHEARCRGQ